MRTILKSTLTIGAALSALALGSGCASQSGSGNSSSSTNTAAGTSAVPNAPGSSSSSSTSGSFQSGSTVTLNLTSGITGLSNLVANIPPSLVPPVNSPTDIQLNVYTGDATNTVIVNYVDNGTPVNISFGSIHPYNPNVSDTSLNGWVTNPDGSVSWKAFYQNEYGAIVLILNSPVLLGDGQPSNTYSGSIWFQPFNQYSPKNPYQGDIKMCWQITAGPYDCRTFIQGNSVVPGSSLYPNNHGPNRSSGYQKLGTFSGLSLSDAGITAY